MSRKFVYESFENYMNYVLLMESEDCETCGKKFLNEEGDSESEETPEEEPWSFNFGSGQFKKSEVSDISKEVLEDDFKKNVLPFLEDPDYIGKKIEVSIEATSSKVPIRSGGEVAKELQAAGYSPDNLGLCKARAKTVIDLVKDVIFKNYAAKGEDRDKFFTQMKDKLTFKAVPKPNIGVPFNPKVDKGDDEKYEEYQYISAVIDVYGDEIEEDKKIPCNKEITYSGSLATKENGYLGYDKTVYLSLKSGQKMTIDFDPLTVPDSILFKYLGVSKLSPFSGNIGGIFARISTPARIAELDKYIKEGKTIPYEKKKYGNKEYLVQDFKKHLNEKVNSGNSLVQSIEKKLKSLGLKSIKEICPGFFDKDGKIEVYATSTPERLKSFGVPEISETADLILGGLLPKPPMADKTKVSIEVKKNIFIDSVSLAAFSPVSGTSFQLKTKCG